MTHLFTYTNFQTFSQDARSRQASKEDIIFIIVPGSIVGSNQVEIITHHPNNFILRKKQGQKCLDVSSSRSFFFTSDYLLRDRKLKYSPGLETQTNCHPFVYPKTVLTEHPCPGTALSALGVLGHGRAKQISIHQQRLRFKRITKETRKGWKNCAKYKGWKGRLSQNLPERNLLI